METISDTNTFDSQAASTDSRQVAAPRRRTNQTNVVMAPSFQGPRQAQADWRSLRSELQSGAALVLDMSNVTTLERAAIAQIIGFLQDADRAQTRITMRNIPAKTQAMLEILGVHRLVEIAEPQPSRR